MTDDLESLGLRERKKRETRFALSRAAIRLTIERGWGDVTVDDIAAAANVSARTFRNYFASKAEAIAASHLERALRTADELRARPAAEPLWDAVVNAVAAQFPTEPDPHAERWLTGIQVVLTEPAVHAEVLKANAIAQDDLAAVVAERTGTDVARDVYPQLVAAVVGAGSAVAVTHWLRSGPTGSVAPLLRDVFDRITAGLPVP